MNDKKKTKEDMETTAEGEKIINIEENKKENLQKEKIRKKEKTFTRDELNKIINAEKKKERQAILKEIENSKIINEISKTKLNKI